MEPANAEPKVLGSATLPGVRESVPCARYQVRQWLGSGHPAIDDVVLATSELVTNAITHSGCGRDDFIGITLAELDGVLFIEVNDPGSLVSEPEVRKDPDAENGRGLLIVRELSQEWGTRDHGPGLGRSVWCAIQIAPGVESVAVPAPMRG
ncbi:ATP-binding protein [Sphaerisporangium perillae]|uniref:ATP-binding protein n=1 Tax=Sphaerisporangium perillae TaxID=2935860 RepID=UPI00200D5404|nr:ATP-binding protein [Sphaerisporangium perillae]